MTGVAATHLKNGTTIDHRLALKRSDNPTNPLTTKIIEKIKKLWQEATGVLVDEILMADMWMLLRFHRALQAAMNNSLPFDGVHNSVLQAQTR